MEIRYQPEQIINLQILGAGAQRLPARLATLTGRNAALKLDRGIEFGAAVRIDLEDSMLLGEVCGCCGDLNGFTVQVHVLEAIPSMSDLARLVSAVMNEGRSAAPDRLVTHAAAAGR